MDMVNATANPPKKNNTKNQQWNTMNKFARRVSSQQQDTRLKSAEWRMK